MHLTDPQILAHNVYPTELGYVHTHMSVSTSPSPGFRLRVVCHSYKLHPHKWSVRSHLYKHRIQRMSVDNLL